MKTRRQLSQVGWMFCGWVLVSASLSADDWNRFRGPNGSGAVAASPSPPPTQWGDAENIAWKTNLPGRGSSSPIVVGNRVLVTSYSDYGLDKNHPGEVANLKRHLSCFDLASGKLLWDQVISSRADEDAYEGFITDHGYASSTPASDGQRVFAMFGKTGLFAFDIQGRELWSKSLGDQSDPNKWGNGSSPVLYKDLVILNAGIEGHALVALKQETGDEVWRVADDSFTSCWSTPILVDVGGQTELVFSMPGKILALNPETGAELWFAKSPIEQTVCASLVQDQGRVYAMGGLGGVAIGFKCGGRGDVTTSHRLWQEPLRAGIDTPLVVAGHLYWTAMGAAFCASCESGKLVYKEALSEPSRGEGRRSPTGDYASPIAIGDAIYMVTRSGKTHVFRAGPKFEKLATNEFPGDSGPFNASPAVAGDKLLIRSDSTLYCISSH